MDAIISAAVERYRTIFLLLFFIFVAGLGSYMTIPKESSPDVQIPIIYVSLRYEGISPEDGERLLLRPMEKELLSIEGLKKLESHAAEGFASLVLEFDAGFDSDRALEDVRNKVDEVKPELPEDTDEPVVQEVNFSRFPILNVILTGDVPKRTLIRIAQDLQDKVEGISEVLEAKIAGDREESLEITIDPLALESYRLTPQETFAVLRNNNILVAAGEIDNGGGSFAVKLPGVVESLEDLRNLPIKVKGEAVVTLSDIAKIRRNFKDIQKYARMNGSSAVVLGVSKRTGANIIETVAQVRALVAVEQAYWPQGVQVYFSQDNSDQILTMLSELQNNVVFALVLVMIVMLAVMGLRNALLVSMTIPAAFLFGVLMLALGGFTMNIVVLFSLILSIGLLVDAGIVVSEYADRKMMSGMPPREAYPHAAKRMAWPVIASTITTLIVFTPLLFWPGVVGQFMRYMPITLLFTLSGSLLMALIFLPTVGARIGGNVKLDPDEKRRTLAAEEGKWDELGKFSRSYVDVLKMFLKFPGRLVAATMAVVTVIIVIFASSGPGVEFFPDIEPENAKVLVRARGNLSVDEKNEYVKQVEQRIADMKDEVRIFYTTAGKFSQGQGGEYPEDTIGEIQMEFVDWLKRRPSDEILEEIRQRVQGIPGIVIETQKAEKGPPTGKPIQVEFASRFPDLLAPAVEELVTYLQQRGGYKDIEDNRPVPEIEWELEVNRELAGRYGLDILTIGNFVKMVTNGIIVTDYRPDDADDVVDIILRFPEKYRNIAQLDNLRINTPSGDRIPISNFITRVPQQKISTLNRIDGRRVMTVKADLAPGILADARVKEIKQWMMEQSFDPNLQVIFRGEDEEQKEAGQFLTMAFVVALFTMALVMVTQFNSIYSMVVIMSAVFFSTGGVMLGLLIAWEPFGIVMCGVAIIALAGVVVNNNIIFIDTYDLHRADGLPAYEALLRTGAMRLRPILLTAVTTILGLVPMVFSMNIDFFDRTVTFGAPSTQWWVQLSTSIAGGLAFATFLTLIFTPCLLLLGDRYLGRRRQKTA
jgi:multidrug efflux pump